ncbi:MAG: hypothetical protein KatS3mg108_3187 [Isosphaeraceae bacterium]|nr:MAG: hypothetical protein KatS3mg108_3187 [Isosphaeraceae bacterium]
MAIESHAASPSTEADLTPAVENELPAYRAISSLAVASLFFGLLALLCFASQTFQFASVAAVVLGALSLRKIQARPDELTGRGLAQLGITLGLICGLSSGTLSIVQDIQLRSKAEQFVRGELVPILADRDLDGALWYKAPPERRRSMTPEQVRKAMDDPNAPGTAYLRVQAGGLVQLIDELKSHPQASLEFAGIENTGQDELTPMVVARIAVQWPDGADGHEDGDHDHAGHLHDHDPNKFGQFVGLILKCQRQGRSLAWWVDDYMYPYQPASYKPKAKIADHGHDH